MSFSRRSILKAGLSAAAAAATGGCSGSALGECDAADSLDLGAPDAGGIAEVEVTLSAQARSVEAVRGLSTVVYRYEASLRKGASTTVTDNASWLGPTLRVHRGQRVRVEFENRLDEPSIVHWHGLDVPQASDGHPRLAIAGKASYQYDFVVRNRAGTYWFHPHPHGRTATQVYAGLAGLVLVSDDEEAALELPSGEYERCLVLQDRTMDAEGRLVYAPDAMTGFLGNQVFVNGEPDPSYQVLSGTYRLRLLNGSNSRIYKLGFSDGTALTLIGTDGGLISAPIDKPYIVLAPGERAEVWIDFARWTKGTRVALQSQTFSLPAPMMRGMGMGRSTAVSSGVINGEKMSVCSFVVGGPGTSKALPTKLTPLDFPRADKVRSTRSVRIEMSHMSWLLNGGTFDMTGVDDNERFGAGEVAEWEFDNSATMMTMAHPIHIHGTQFQIVSREQSRVSRATLDSLRLGLTDEGWKDTVLVLPGERVRLRQQVTDYPGLFLYHCHNLEHEDSGMMRNYCVQQRAA